MIATEPRPHLHGIEIGAMDESEVGEAAGVLARALRDSPILVAALGGNTPRRQEALARLFAGAATALDVTRQTLVARCADGSIVGVCRIVPPGGRRPTTRHFLRLLPLAARLGPRSIARLLRLRRSWSSRTPAERHWRLGPLAIDPHLLGRGIDDRLMQVACAQLDAAGEDAFLETDRSIAVAFYEGYGFAVVGQDTALGATIWSMRRPAERRRIT